MQDYLHGAMMNVISKYPSTEQLIVRLGQTEDLPRVCKFYLEHPAPYLPIPSIKDIGDALYEGRFLIVEREHDQAIFAVSALLGFTPLASKNQVIEVTAMLVSQELGGLDPVRVQTLLAALLVVRHVGFHLVAVKPGYSNTILAIIHHRNTGSLANFRRLEFSRLEDLPGWIDFDTLSWFHEGDEKEDWHFYYASDLAVIRSLQVFTKEGGYTEGTIMLSRQNRTTGWMEQFVLRIAIAGFDEMLKDLAPIESGGISAALVPPPLTLGWR